MIRFFLNEKEIQTNLSPGMTLVDFIRYQQNLHGTKIGCREGDCGACTVLVGELINDNVRYRSMTSCLMPLGNAHGKHIVTVEGTNVEGLNPIQRAMVEEGSSQCGFCTPGFIVSLAGFCLSDREPTCKAAIASIDGNICRCTGYKSIERSACQIANLMQERTHQDVTEFVTKKKILPEYFSKMKEKLKHLHSQINQHPSTSSQRDPSALMIGGGTDLNVQKPEKVAKATLHLTLEQEKLKGIHVEGNRCVLGASSTVTDLLESEIINRFFPGFPRYAKLVSSTPIRNMATLAGNFVNASPIGDMTIFFLALDAHLLLVEGTQSRTVPLRSFYKGYKTLDKTPGEIIETIYFPIPEKGMQFNFEKVSKRTNLDIASVNSAMQIKIDKGKIQSVGLSAGGVGPTPKYLSETCHFLIGKQISDQIIREAIAVAQKEVSPIDDVRGSAAYKRLLLQQLILSHFNSLEAV